METDLIYTTTTTNITTAGARLILLSVLLRENERLGGIKPDSMNIDECCPRKRAVARGENKAAMKNVIVVQLRCILEQAVTAASNIISVRRNVLLESSTCTERLLGVPSCARVPCF